MRKNLKRQKPDYRGVSLIESLDFPLLFDTLEFVSDCMCNSAFLSLNIHTDTDSSPQAK